MQTKTFSKERKRYIGLMKTLMAVSAVLTCALVAFLIIYVMYKGLPNLSWELLTTEPSYLADKIGIYPDILNTIYIVLATLVVVLPLGVGAAIYLTEYAQNKKLVAVIEYAAETLSGIPSIIYGLVGMMFFCEFLGMGTCLKAGSLTLVIMNLPTIMAYHAGKSQDRAAVLSRGRVRFGCGQVARDPDCGISGLCGWHHHRLYFGGRTDSRRNGGAFVYGGLRA